MQGESGKTERCNRCFGRAFIFKTGGYTSADRIVCPKCGGKGLVPESPTKGGFKGIVTDAWERVGYIEPPKKKRDSLYRRYGVDC